ncbi:MAG: DUF2238 domain-containing protein [Lacipirellulaceae bacterium]
MTTTSETNSRSQYQLLLAVFCAASLALSLMSPIYPRQQWLQHVPTVFGIAFLLANSQRRWLSNLSMACITAFLLLHIVGARWIYSYVPYDNWINAILGTDTSEAFGWKRNHYDRFVHLAFGILFTYPLAEACVKLWRLKRLHAISLAFTAVLAVSAAYEIFEWLLAIVAAPEFAERYNGQQGDFWDPQKDMALAGIGSLIIGIGLAISGRRLDNLLKREDDNL